MTPWIRRRRRAGLSSRKPTTRVSGVSASSRASARARAAGADDEDALLRGAAHAAAARAADAARAATPRRASCRGARRRRRSRAGSRANGADRPTIPIVIGTDSATAAADREQVARRGEAPDPPVDPEEDEEDVADGEQDRQRGEEERRAGCSCRSPSTNSRYAARNETQMIAKSASTSTRRRGLERNARQSGGDGPGSSRRDRSCRSPRKLANWTRTTNEISTPTAVTRAFAEHVVGERGRAEQRREQRQRRDRLLLGEAVVDEPVRGVVGAALGDGPALERPPNRHERRVQDRDREHEQRQHDAGQRRAGGRPARGERERGEAEADHLAAGVAHEDARAAAGTQVEGEEAEAGAAERERDHERELARVCVERRRPRRRRRRRSRATRRGRPCCRAG